MSKGKNEVDTKSGFGYSELCDAVRKLEQSNSFIHVETIGESVMGKQIVALRLGEGSKLVHYNGAFHANEWITSWLLMKFVEDYAEALNNNSDLWGVCAWQLFQNSTVCVVPMVNPDGVELAQQGLGQRHPFAEQLLCWNGGSHNFAGWKANVRGVDLNDQFPAFWEEEKERRSTPGPGPMNYSGDAPLSEPEAAAMAEFTRHHPFRLAIAFHSQGEEIYWNYRDFEPQEAEVISGEFARASGYRSVKLTGSDAGYKDWFIQEFRRPGYTVEVGNGVNPLPISQFSDIYSKVLGIMVKGLLV